MALECDGHGILDQNEFRELAQLLEFGYWGGAGTLQGWFLGEELSPPDLFDALTVDAALAVRDARAEELVDLALNRLISAFPELQP